jgi:hypothetical protein
MDTKLVQSCVQFAYNIIIGCDLFGLAAKGHGRVMGQGAIEPSRGSNDGYSRTCRKAEDKEGIKTAH